MWESPWLWKQNTEVDMSTENVLKPITNLYFVVVVVQDAVKPFWVHFYQRERFALQAIQAEYLADSTAHTS